MLLLYCWIPTLEPCSSPKLFFVNIRVSSVKKKSKSKYIEIHGTFFLQRGYKLAEFVAANLECSFSHLVDVISISVSIHLLAGMILIVLCIFWMFSPCLRGPNWRTAPYMQPFVILLLLSLPRGPERKTTQRPRSYKNLQPSTLTFTRHVNVARPPDQHER